MWFVERDFIQLGLYFNAHEYAWWQFVHCIIAYPYLYNGNLSLLVVVVVVVSLFAAPALTADERLRLWPRTTGDLGGLRKFLI